MYTARGFGMRVVGGKVGPDGRLFAYIVWTVPGGPAEKGGLQQGDKVSKYHIKGKSYPNIAPKHFIYCRSCRSVQYPTIYNIRFVRFEIRYSNAFVCHTTLLCVPLKVH